MGSLNLSIQQLSELDRSSPQFPDQLSTLLDEEECRNNIPNLSDQDAAWLVEYLDDVRTTHLCANLAS